MKIEIGMPVYRSSGRLEAVLTSLGKQTNKNFFVTIYNDTNPEEVDENIKVRGIVNRIRETYKLDITLVNNPYNMGYMKNMHQIFDNASADILFLLADDDIISNDCIELVERAFLDESVGIVARPYYWFNDNMRMAIRFEGESYGKIMKTDINGDNIELVKKCVSSAGQLSGLAFKVSELVGMPFEEDMFTAHVYPFLYVFAKKKCAYMPYTTVAVSAGTSQCHTDIYSPSPLWQWIRLFNNVLSDERYSKIREELIKMHVKNYIGWAQIKCYGSYDELIREVYNYAKYYPMNLLCPSYYLFAIGVFVFPKKILISLISAFKIIRARKDKRIVDIPYEKFPLKEVERFWNAPEPGERMRNI